MGMGGSGFNSRKHLTDADLEFLRDPANKAFADSLSDKVTSKYLFPPTYTQNQIKGMAAHHRLPRRADAPLAKNFEDIVLQIENQRSLIKGRDYFQRAASDRAAQLPLILQQLQMQQPNVQGPQLNAFGFNQPPQLQGFQGAQPQLGGLQGNLLGGLGTFGQQQIAAGQQHNPTILKAK